jgi:RNA polymerase sigma-70 factor, ECF subfamily
MPAATPPSQPDFEQVMREHAPFVWRVLARHGVDESQLEDVSQDVFLTLHRSLPRFEGRSSLRTFLYGICRRVASNHRHRAVHRREVVTDAPPEPAPQGASDAFETLAEKQSLELVHALVARLPAEQREVFMLYEVDELTMREIAEALDCSQNTLFSRLYAARRTLAAELARLRAKRRVA